MGTIGFVFECSKSTKVILTESNKINGNYIIGTKSKFDYKKCEFSFLSKELKLSKFLTFEKSKFNYAKICLSQNTFVDFQNLTMWFGTRKYRELRQLFEIHEENESNEELIKKYLDIYDYFL